MGGCLISENLMWASTMLGFNSRPPDPAVVGERWREMWRERLERGTPWVVAWLRHQRRDAFWRHGSVCEDPAAITCPVYAMGGWADAYTNAIPRTLAGLPGPKKGLIGPWAHKYPDSGRPGPAVGFSQECLRWWDYWLKGVDTGIMDEPLLRAWMRESVPPRTSYREWPGRWVAEAAWPPPNAARADLYLDAPDALAESPAGEVALQFRGTPAHGHAAGVWCPYGRPGDLPGDQRAEDGLSLCFTSPPLAERQEILGFPEVTLTLAVDRPLALVAVRLCDVRPDGASLLVTRGLLNLAHRESHEHPAPLEPGKRYTVTVRLNAIAHALPPGHRWRVAVSPDYWPHAWPSPEPVTLTLFTGAACRLALPVRAPRPAEDEALPAFGPPEGSAPLAFDRLRPSSREVRVTQDAVTGRIELVNREDGGHYRQQASGVETASVSTDTYSIVEGDPLTAAVRCERSYLVARGGWRTRVETVSSLTADAGAFRVTNALEAYEGEARVFAKTWSFSAPRDLV
jgi:hypothetical protein